MSFTLYSLLYILYSLLYIWLYHAFSHFADYSYHSM